MADYTRLKDGVPILRPVNMPSEAQGHEAMAEVFGKVGKAAASEVIQIRDEQSNASLYQASNQIYRIKNESHQLMLQNPDQTSKIAEDSINNMNMVISNTPMLASDKQKLEYMADRDMTDVKIQGLKIGSDHIKTQAMISFETQWPEKINQIQQSWNDPKLAEYQTDNARKAVSDAMKSGLITPRQGMAYFDTLKETLDRALEANELYQSPDKHSARNLHAAINVNGKNNSFQNMHLPSEESTNFLYGHHVNQTNYQDVVAAQFRGERPDAMLYQSKNLTDHQREEIKINQKVIDSVDASINSGASWDELEKRESELDSINDNMLSTAERAEKTYLKQWKEGFTKDKYLIMMGHTVLGSKASYDHQMAINAIQSNGAYTNEYKQSLIRYYDNQFMDKMVSAGEAYRIPPNRIAPVPSPLVMIAQGAFKQAGNPLDLLNTVDHYNARNRVYVANAMKTPVQKEIAYTVGILEGKTNNDMRALLISANQPGIDFGVLKGREKGEESISKNTIQSKVFSDPNIGKITNYLSKFKSESDKQRNSAMIEMTTNAVMYQSIRDNDIKLENHEKNIASWGKEYAKGYDIYNGSDFAFNRKQQPQISDYEWASLAQYAKKQADIIFATEGKKKGYTDLDIRQSKDINPWYVTITSDNRIVAQDQYGNPVFSQILDHALLTHAVRDVKMGRIEAEKKIAGTEEKRTLSARQMIKERFG